MADPSLALVIGANRGIGLAVVEEFLRQGWSVIATARKPDEANALKSLAIANTGRLTIEALDMTDPTQAAAFVSGLAGKPLDAVLINGGTSGPAHRGAEQATAEEVGALMLTNAVAPVRLARALAPLVKPDTGVLAFTSSILGSVSLGSDGYHELYRASKAALNSLTQGLWTAVKSRGITLLNLHPGWVRTDMGGPSAPIAVEDSARGLVETMIRESGAHHHAFIDFTGQRIAW